MSAATFSLRTLLMLIAVAAVGCYALTQRTPLWGNIIVTMSYALLALGAILAFVRRGPSRAFWTGFAITGWAYAAMAFSPFLFTGSGGLLTTKGLAAGWEYVGMSTPPPDTSSRGVASLPDRDLSDIEGGYLEIMMGFNSSFYSAEQQEYLKAIRAYLRIGQSLWALTLGFGAGLLAAVLYLRERRKGETPAASEPS